MQRIEDILNLPPKFFLRPVLDNGNGIIFYRSRASATKTQCARAQRRHDWWKEIVEYLRGFVRFPVPNLPAFELPDDPNAISNDAIESLAQKTREFWRLGDAPIDNCCWLLENQGAIVTYGQLGSETLDSFSEWDTASGTPFVFLGSEKDSAVRSRLNTAHELGHLVLHRQISAHHHDNPADHKRMEQQANDFASAFLLPARAFAMEMHAPTLDSFRRLKRKWKISIGAMIIRSEKLGFTSDLEVRRMWIALARKGWRTHEPLDDELEMEEPKLCFNAMDLLLREGVLTKAAILGQGFASQADIETLMCLPQGYLTDHPDPVRSPVVQLQERQQRAPAQPRTTFTTSKVVQFRERTPTN
jgi:Zn-dependent peptidase ImmA (M78 family)